MEKSIEHIWKTGFLDRKALIAPRVNDLYTRKSEHIIEKFKRMFRFNLKAIVVGGVLGPIGMGLLQMPITAMAFFVTLAVVFIVNRRELKELEKVDNTLNSYAYLNAFDSWLKNLLILNKRMARFYYPFLFLGMSLGLWFSFHGPYLYKLLFGAANTGWLINGIPGIALIPVAIIAILLWLFGGRLYQMEWDGFYGRVMNKMDELLAEMEELRADNKNC
jgi:hypothetical protein